MQQRTGTDSRHRRHRAHTHIDPQHTARHSGAARFSGAAAAPVAAVEVDSGFRVRCADIQGRGTYAAALRLTEHCPWGRALSSLLYISLSSLYLSLSLSCLSLCLSPYICASLCLPLQCDDSLRRVSQPRPWMDDCTAPARTIFFWEDADEQEEEEEKEDDD